MTDYSQWLDRLVSVAEKYWGERTRRLTIENDHLEREAKEHGEVYRRGEKREAETPEEYRNLPPAEGRFARAARGAGARE